MTAFPDWPGPHRFCKFCLGQVSTIEAEEHSYKQMNHAFHIECQPEYEKLSTDDRLALGFKLDEHITGLREQWAKAFEEYNK